MADQAQFAYLPSVGRRRQGVRAIFVLGVAWFVAADVCKALGIANVSDAVSRLDEDEKGIATTDTPGGPQEMIVISTPGVYRLIFTSRVPEAERFKRWLAHEVLPDIQRYGYYAPHRKPMSQSKMLIEAKALFLAEFERRRPDGAVAVSEREICAALAEKIVTERLEWLNPMAAREAHAAYHSWMRAQAKVDRNRDPNQPDLWTHYSVLRDGRERWVERNTLSRVETKAFLTRGARVREALRVLVDKLLRHDRAFVADHSARDPEQAFTDDEVKLLAPDLVSGEPPPPLLNPRATSEAPRTPDTGVEHR